MFNKTVLLSLIALAAGLAPASARPLAPAKVPADAKWVMHIDMECLAPSQTYRFLNENPESAASVRAAVAHYKNLLGLDPVKDLSSVTFYGNATTGNDGVAIIGGALKPDRITSLLQTYAKYRTLTAEKKTLMTWQDKASGRPLWACFNSSKELVLASNQPALLGSLGTLNSTRPSLFTRKTGTLPLPATRPGTFFSVSTKGYSGPNPDPVRAEILNNTEHAMLQFSEDKGFVDGQVVLLAISPDAANLIEKTMKGWVFLGTLTDQTNPLAKLAEKSQIVRNGSTINMKVRCSAKDAASLLSAFIANK